MSEIIRWSHVLAALCLFGLWARAADGLGSLIQDGSQPTFKVGDRLPDAQLMGRNGSTVRLTDTRGRVKLISIVPQLNTPVCDAQTHHLSEANEGLDRTVDLVTISTNTVEDQAQFSRKAGIRNITFVSDAPHYDFGKTTGLLLSMYRVLHRAVIVSDRDNIIRYFEVVPMGQLPNFDRAYEAAKRWAVSNEQRQ